MRTAPLGLCVSLFFGRWWCVLLLFRVFACLLVVLVVGWVLIARAQDNFLFTVNATTLVLPLVLVLVLIIDLVLVLAIVLVLLLLEFVVVAGTSGHRASRAIHIVTVRTIFLLLVYYYCYSLQRFTYGLLLVYYCCSLQFFYTR
ncbi:unnamed protein product [Laminaria digitata]